MTNNPREGMDHPPAMTDLQKEFQRLQQMRREQRMRVERERAERTHAAQEALARREEGSLSDNKPDRRPPAPRGYFNCFCGNMHKLDVLGRATDHKDDRPPEPEKIDLGDPTERRRSATLEVPTLPELRAALTWLANKQGKQPDYYTEDLDEWYRRLTKEN